MSSAVGVVGVGKKIQRRRFLDFTGTRGGSYRLKRTSVGPFLTILLLTYFAFLLEALVVRVNWEKHNVQISVKA